MVITTKKFDNRKYLVNDIYGRGTIDKMNSRVVQKVV